MSGKIMIVWGLVSCKVEDNLANDGSLLLEWEDPVKTTRVLRRKNK